MPPCGVRCSAPLCGTSAPARKVPPINRPATATAATPPIPFDPHSRPHATHLSGRARKQPRGRRLHKAVPSTALQNFRRHAAIWCDAERNFVGRPLPPKTQRAHKPPRHGHLPQTPNLRLRHIVSRPASKVVRHLDLIDIQAIDRSHHGRSCLAFKPGRTAPRIIRRSFYQSMSYRIFC